ncbi:MAG: dihydroneopterin aldolase [Flavobacteriaceae bacterium]
MGIIKVENIKLYAFHGCLDEEARIGSEYSVDVKVHANLATSSLSDNLKDTVDYVLLNKIVADEMAIRSQLLEHVAQRILDSIFKQSALVNYAEVAVSKLNPPIGGNVEKVTIVLSKERC